MNRNTFRTFATLAILALGLFVSTASPARAQIRIIDPTLPTIFLPGPNYLSEITAGAFHTCVRKYNGTVLCWGLNGWYTGTGGQVGVTSTNSCADKEIQNPNQISVPPVTYRPCVPTPQVVPQTLSPVSQVVAGWYHTCALSGGTASCWGSNASGALGDGGLTDRTNPQAVAWPQGAGAAVQFTSLSAGDSATCGLSAGGVFCWGSSFYDPNAASYSAKPKLLNAFNGFRGFTVGSRFGCGVYIVGGWGENDCQGLDNKGQLGLDGSASWVPKYLTYDRNGNVSSSTPYTPFFVMSATGFGSDGAPHVARSAAGAAFMCAEVMDGTVQCVGSNDSGQLGTQNNQFDHASGAAVTNTGGTALQLHGVTTGDNHACALDPSGYAYCWGSGQYGELGHNATGYGLKSYGAVPVAGGVTFRALAAGHRHTCGIGTDNYVYCWGDNEYGQLGVGLNTIGTSPGGFTPATYTGYLRRLGPL